MLLQIKEKTKPPGIHTNNHYRNVIKSIKTKSNSKDRADRKKENTGRRNTNFPKL